MVQTNTLISDALVPPPPPAFLPASSSKPLTLLQLGEAPASATLDLISS